MYHLKDAFPELCKVYAIISAIPISSCTAERSFSALKRVKTRLRSTMVQERLEGLLLLSVDRKILLTLTKESVIDSFAHSSSHLSSALLYFNCMYMYTILCHLHVKMTVTISDKLHATCAHIYVLLICRN